MASEVNEVSERPAEPGTGGAGRARRAVAGRAVAEYAVAGQPGTAAEPGGAGWRRDADVVVVGSGAAGISVALTAAGRGLRVLVVTKDLVGGATPLAQGGLAAALGAGDSAAAHLSDTLTAGAGLCEPDVVAALADAAPGAVSWLTGLGARLETRELRLEGGHSAHRIVHSGDDATGAEVHRALLGALLASGIEILDRTVALDLLLDDGGPGDSSGREDVEARGNDWGRGNDGYRGDTGRAGTGAGARAGDGAAAANAGPGRTLASEPVPAHSPERRAGRRAAERGRRDRRLRGRGRRGQERRGCGLRGRGRRGRGRRGRGWPGWRPRSSGRAGG